MDSDIEKIERYCRKQIQQKYTADEQHTAYDRLEAELTEIERQCFGEELFTITAWLEKKKLQACNISGYGEWMNELVYYLLGLTETDPIRYQLSSGLALRKFEHPVFLIPDFKDNEFQSVKIKNSSAEFIYSKDLRILKLLSKATGVDLKTIPITVPEDGSLKAERIANNIIEQRFAWFRANYEEVTDRICYEIALETEVGKTVWCAKNNIFNFEPSFVVYGAKNRKGVAFVCAEELNAYPVLQAKFLIESTEKFREAYARIPLIEEDFTAGSFYDFLKIGDSLEDPFWKGTAKALMKKAEELRNK